MAGNGSFMGRFEEHPNEHRSAVLINLIYQYPQILAGGPVGGVTFKDCWERHCKFDYPVAIPTNRKSRHGKSLDNEGKGRKGMATANGVISACNGSLVAPHKLAYTSSPC